MLPKARRVSKKDFLSLGKATSTARGLFFSAKNFSTKNTTPRAAVVVSKKTIRTAVARNKVRRLVYGLIQKKNVAGTVVVTVIKNPGKTKKEEVFADLERSLEALFAETGHIG